MSRSGLTGGEAQDHALGAIWKERREFQNQPIPSGHEISQYFEQLQNPTKEYTYVDQDGDTQTETGKEAADSFYTKFQPTEPEQKYWSTVY